MLLEALIITTCLQNKGGCHESSEAYYKGSPELQQMTKRGERMVKENVPKPVLEYMFPVAAAIAGKKGTIKISNHWAIEIDKNSGGVLMLRWTY